MSAGYSGTPLAKKLGITEGATFVALNAPANYDALLAPLPRGAKRLSRTPACPRLIHVFSTRRADLSARLTKLRTSMDPDGMVWVSWPKKAAKVPTDITEDVIRDVALPMGFVDVKVCAVDETWSGLKLVVRRTLR